MAIAAGGEYPVQMVVPEQRTYNRFYAIPLIGILAKLIILIPHFIVLWVLFVVFEVLQLVTWIPVLFGGKYPSGLHRYVAGVFRWWVRIQAFLWGLTDRYPPFSLQ